MSVIPEPHQNAEYDLPMDIVERTADSLEWDYVRQEDSGDIEIMHKGEAATYEIIFTWVEENEILHIVCRFDCTPIVPRVFEIQKLIFLINERLWLGHFDLWLQERVILFRYGLLLSGDSDLQPAQCKTMRDIAIAMCDKYFEAFQFVNYGGKSAADAFQLVDFNTVGSA